MHGGDIYRNKVKIDFSVNINPLGMPESVERVLRDAIGECSTYPDIENEELIKAVSSMTGADNESIVCTNGASELFMAAVHGLKPGKVLIPVPSFSGYERAVKAVSADVIFYEMKKEDGFCLKEEILNQLTENIDMLFLANPNNPTGSFIEPELLEKILKHCREKGIIVVLDECFIEFMDEWEKYSFLCRAEGFLNLIIVRSFTKIFAIPGIRLGYMVCKNHEIVKKIKEQLPEWNISVFAQKAGSAAAKETEYVKRSAEFVKKERDYLKTNLNDMGIKVYPSAADYLLIYSNHPIGEELLKQGILVRDCKDFRGLSKGYYRIAVKARKDNEKLLEAIKRIISVKKREE